MSETTQKIILGQEIPCTIPNIEYNTAITITQIKTILKAFEENIRSKISKLKVEKTIKN